MPGIETISDMFHTSQFRQFTVKHIRFDRNSTSGSIVYKQQYRAQSQHETYLMEQICHSSSRIRRIKTWNHFFAYKGKLSSK